MLKQTESSGTSRSSRVTHNLPCCHTPPPFAFLWPFPPHHHTTTIRQMGGKGDAVIEQFPPEEFALKVINKEKVSSMAALKRVDSEIGAQMTLRHRGILQVHDVINGKHGLYVIMDKVSQTVFQVWQLSQPRSWSFGCCQNAHNHWSFRMSFLSVCVCAVQSQQCTTGWQGPVWLLWWEAWSSIIGWFEDFGEVHHWCDQLLSYSGTFGACLFCLYGSKPTPVMLGLYHLCART